MNRFNPESQFRMTCRRVKSGLRPVPFLVGCSIVLTLCLFCFFEKAGSAIAGKGFLTVTPEKGEETFENRQISLGVIEPQSEDASSRSIFRFDQRKDNVGAWIKELSDNRGVLLTDTERDGVLDFLAGKIAPQGMRGEAVPWLADELLTVLRMQEPSWDRLAEKLEWAAFQPNTDPVVRDYIMQHLGHCWEQNGVKSGIEATLWRGVGTSDSTTPATALIALARGYEREGRSDQLKRVQTKAFELAQDVNKSIGVRATALSLAGGSESLEVKKYAGALLAQSNTPEILRKVAKTITHYVQ